MAGHFLSERRHQLALSGAAGTTLVVIVVDGSLVQDGTISGYASVILAFMLAFLFWELVAWVSNDWLDKNHPVDGEE